MTARERWESRVEVARQRWEDPRAREANEVGAPVLVNARIAWVGYLKAPLSVGRAPKYLDVEVRLGVVVRSSRPRAIVKVLARDVRKCTGVLHAVIILRDDGGGNVQEAKRKHHQGCRRDAAAFPHGVSPGVTLVRKRGSSVGRRRARSLDLPRTLSVRGAALSSPLPSPGPRPHTVTLILFFAAMLTGCNNSTTQQRKFWIQQWFI